MTTTLLLLALAVQDAPPGWQTRLEKASATADAWAARRAEIRRQILVAGGLWPEMPAPPVKAVVDGRVERDGYSVEKVRLETWPGVWLTGNLYRPLGKKGPFPGVLHPHGHFKVGRYNNDALASHPGRALTFARLGFVAFSYDMVGYGDFTQLPHKFEDLPYGQGLFGLQTWNSLRAMDFLASLPDVDPARLGCTGESGGGTQTYILTAVDDRVKVSVPVNMVAGEFQGGCSCENAPFLRLGLNNVEIAAATAPRPLFLICCTKDWTKGVPEREAPVVRGVYERLGVADRFRVVRFDAPHNYNQDSREVAYAFFRRWLQDGPADDRLPEPAFTVEPRENLAVEVPGPKADAETLKASLRDAIRRQIAELWPRDDASRARFRELLRPAFRISLALRPPTPPALQRSGGAATLVVATTPEAAEAYKALEGYVPLVLKPHAPEPADGGDARQQKQYTTTYYRTELARQVQDVVDHLAALEGTPVRLIGVGEAGVPTLLARALHAPARGGVTVVDWNGLDEKAEEAFPHPGLLRLGGLRAAAALVDGPLILHDARGRLERTLFAENVKVSDEELSPAGVAHIK